MSLPIGACGHLFPLVVLSCLGPTASPPHCCIAATHVAVVCMLASRCFSSLGSASFAVVLRCPCFSAALLRGLDADPLRLWWLEPVCSLAVSVFFGVDIIFSLAVCWAPYLLCSCLPFAVGCLLDVGLVSQ